MDLEYIRARNRATFLALRDNWYRFLAWWQRLHTCKAVDWSMVPRALCVLDRNHGGLHEDENGHTWAGRVAGGHVRVEPEVEYCPCGGDCHRRTIPCSPACIVHRLRRAGRD